MKPNASEDVEKLLVGMWNNTAMLENCDIYLYKTKHGTTTPLSNYTPGY